MSYLAAFAATILVCALLLRLERSRAAEFNRHLCHLQEARVRFWRARLALDAAEGEAREELERSCAADLARFVRVTETVRDRFAEEAVGEWIATAAHAREMEEMRDALAGGPWDRAEARARVREGGLEAQRLRREGAPDLLPRFLVHGGFGAALGGLLAFYVPYRITAGFYLEDSAGPLAAITVGGALLGFVIGGIGKEWAWARLLGGIAPAGWSARRVLTALGASIAAMVIGFAALYRPPAPEVTAGLLEALAERTGCPRPIPALPPGSLPRMGERERCAVVQTALAAIPAPAPGEEVRILSARELDAANILWLAPFYRNVHLSNIWTWEVWIGVARPRPSVHRVSVDRRTGAVHLR